MSKGDMRILFMGTPDFAEAALKALYEAGENIVGVITQPDRACGRGMKQKFCDVKRYALEVGLPVYQPEKLKDGAILPLLEELKPDVAVVAAYGRILPQYVLDFPKYGCINIHGSLLPEYRGAAPIQRAVIEGKAKTGVTVMQMDAGLDTGDMLLCREAEIPHDADTGEMYDVLAALGGSMIVETMDMIRQGKLCPVKQDDTLATYASKITAEDEEIPWELTAAEIHNRIRGLFPFPTAKTVCGGKILKLCKAHICTEDEARLAQSACTEDTVCGQVVYAGKGKIFIKCGQGFISLECAKPEGSKMLSAADLVNGRRISAGEILGK